MIKYFTCLVPGMWCLSLSVCLQSDKSSRRLCAEEKACLTFLEETIESMVTEDGALFSDDAQSSGSAISKNHHVSYGVHQDRYRKEGVAYSFSPINTPTLVNHGSL